MVRATQKRFRKQGYSKISSKFLAKKANGTRVRRKTKPKTIVFVNKGKAKFVKATPANKRRIKKKGVKSEVF